MLKSYLPVGILEWDGICLDESAELSMFCKCMGNTHKFRGKHGPAHNDDDQVYNVSELLEYEFSQSLHFHIHG